MTTAFTGLDAFNVAHYTGTLANAVVLNGGDAFDAAPHLVFLYQFSNDGSSADGITRMTTTDFGPSKAGLIINADSAFFGGQPLGAGGLPALTVDRKGTGNVVGFQDFGGLGGVVSPGSFTNTLFIETTATEFALTGSTNFLDGGIATVKTFAPVPEPASLALVGICFAGLGGTCALRRWRKGT
jgi:hypothetical protein